MFYSLPKPVIFAHRGASSHAPENTLAAFQVAVEQGASAIELDVQLTADQEVVVFHDLSLARTTDGEGKVTDYTLAELSNFDAGVQFDPAYRGERIPSLADVFSSLPETIFLNIELKNLTSQFDELPKITADIIRDYRAQQRVLISSFNPLALYRFQHQIPEIPRGRLLYSGGLIKLHKVFKVLNSGYQSIHLPYRSLTRKTIKSFQDRGLKVFCYTLNHPQDIIDAVDSGIDGFFTDNPKFAKQLLTQEQLLGQQTTAINQGY